MLISKCSRILRVVREGHESDSGSMLVEPEKFSTLSRLSAMPEVMDSQSARTFSLAAAAPMEASDDDKKKAAEELMKKLG